MAKEVALLISSTHNGMAERNFHALFEPAQFGGPARLPRKTPTASQRRPGLLYYQPDRKSVV